MNNAISKFKGARIVAFMAVLSGPCVYAMGQDTSAGKQIVTIDGASHPDLIPEWILWRELFNGALLLAEKAPNAGRDFWQDRFGFTPAQVDHLVAHARALRAAENAANAEIKKLNERKDLDKGAIQSQIHYVQADNESRILEIRDRLKSNIGIQAYERLKSYARINLARNIKVGQSDVKK